MPDRLIGTKAGQKVSRRDLPAQGERHNILFSEISRPLFKSPSFASRYLHFDLVNQSLNRQTAMWSAIWMNPVPPPQSNPTERSTSGLTFS